MKFYSVWRSLAAFRVRIVRTASRRNGLGGLRERAVAIILMVDAPLTRSSRSSRNSAEGDQTHASFGRRLPRVVHRYQLALPLWPQANRRQYSRAERLRSHRAPSRECRAVGPYAISGRPTA